MVTTISKQSFISASSLIAICFALVVSAAGQTPSPTPEPSTAGTYGSLRLTSSVELGVRERLVEVDLVEDVADPFEDRPPARRPGRDRVLGDAHGHAR